MNPQVWLTHQIQWSPKVCSLTTRTFHVNNQKSFILNDQKHSLTFPMLGTSSIKTNRNLTTDRTERPNSCDTGSHQLHLDPDKQSSLTVLVYNRLKMGGSVQWAFSTSTILVREKIKKPEQQASSTHFMWRLLKALFFDQITIIWPIKPTNYMFYLLFPECKQLGDNYSNGSIDMKRKEKNLLSLLFIEDTYQSVWNCIWENFHRNLVSPDRAETAKGNAGQIY